MSPSVTATGVASKLRSPIVQEHSNNILIGETFMCEGIKKKLYGKQLYGKKKKKELKFKLSTDGKVSTVGTTESKHLPWHSINTSLLYTF